MSDHSFDDELRNQFQALKRADAGRTPGFDGMLARAQADAARMAVSPARERRVIARRIGWIGGLAAAAAIAAVIVAPRVRTRDASDEAFEQAVKAFHESPVMGGWRSPTAELLDLPGNSLISTTPNVSIAR